MVYVHDTPGGTSDRVRLQVSDGEFSDTKTVNVVIGIVTDETPRVTINTGLRVKPCE